MNSFELACVLGIGSFLLYVAGVAFFFIYNAKHAGKEPRE